MNDQIDSTMSLQDKRDTIKNEYADPEKSICCAAHILANINQNFGDYTWVTIGKNCNAERPQIVYSGWDTATRLYNGGGCPYDQNSLYYVERTNELKDAFDVAKIT
jgi:hypothetical protein